MDGRIHQVAAEVIRRAMAEAASGHGYVVRVSDPPTAHEQLQLLAARLAARPIVILPHVCRSMEEWPTWSRREGNPRPARLKGIIRNIR
jgi:hypothetical protein